MFIKVTYVSYHLVGQGANRRICGFDKTTKWLNYSELQSMETWQPKWDDAPNKTLTTVRLSNVTYENIEETPEEIIELIRIATQD